MIKTRIIFLFLSLAVIYSTYSQRKHVGHHGLHHNHKNTQFGESVNPWKIGVNLGGSNYYGDFTAISNIFQPGKVVFNNLAGSIGALSDF